MILSILMSVEEQKQNSTARFILRILDGVSFQPNNNNFIDFFYVYSDVIKDLWGQLMTAAFEETGNVISKSRYTWKNVQTLIEIHWIMCRWAGIL